MVQRYVWLHKVAFHQFIFVTNAQNPQFTRRGIRLLAFALELQRWWQFSTIFRRLALTRCCTYFERVAVGIVKLSDFGGDAEKHERYRENERVPPLSFLRGVVSRPDPGQFQIKGSHWPGEIDVLLRAHDEFRMDRLWTWCGNTSWIMDAKVKRLGAPWDFDLTSYPVVRARVPSNDHQATC